MKAYDAQACWQIWVSLPGSRGHTVRTRCVYMTTVKQQIVVPMEGFADSFFLHHY